MINPDFDPYKILQELANNQVRITDEMKTHQHRINQLHTLLCNQQNTIDHLISATANNTKIAEEILKHGQAPNNTES